MEISVSAAIPQVFTYLSWHSPIDMTTLPLKEVNQGINDIGVKVVVYKDGRYGTIKNSKCTMIYLFK